MQSVASARGLARQRRSTWRSKRGTLEGAVLGLLNSLTLGRARRGVSRVHVGLPAEFAALSLMALTREDEVRVRRKLGRDGEMAIGAVASLYVAEFSSTERKLKPWRNAGVRGALCLVREVATGKHFFMVFDQQSTKVLYEFEVYAGITYREAYENFHAYETSDGYVGFGFASTRAAQAFFSYVTDITKAPETLLNGVYFNADGSLNVQHMPSSWRRMLLDAGFTREDLVDPAMAGLIAQCLEEVGLSTQAPQRGLTHEQLRDAGYTQAQIKQYNQYERDLDAYENSLRQATIGKRSATPPPPPRRRPTNGQPPRPRRGQASTRTEASGFEMASQFGGSAYSKAMSAMSGVQGREQSVASAPFGAPRLVSTVQEALATKGIRIASGASAMSAPVPPTRKPPVPPPGKYAQSAPGAPRGSRQALQPNQGLKQAPQRRGIASKMRNSLRRSMGRTAKAEASRPVPGSPPPGSYYQQQGHSANHSRYTQARQGNGAPPPRPPRRATRRTTRKPGKPERRQFGDQGRYPGGTIVRNNAKVAAAPQPPPLPNFPQPRGGANAAKRMTVLPDVSALQSNQADDLKARLRERLEERRKRIASDDEESDADWD